MVDVVSHLVGAALRGGAGVAFVTRQHEAALQESIDSAELADKGGGRILFSSAEETLGELLVEDRLAHDRFPDVINPVLDEVATPGAPLHVYSELSGLLWEKEEFSAVAELESLFAELAATRGFSLLTGYMPPSDGVGRPLSSFEKMLGLHASLLAAPAGERAPGRITQAASSYFSPEASAPAKVRAFAREVLARWHVAPVDDAVLVASELSTNAVVHAGSSFSVMLARQGDGIRVAVTDQTVFSDERDPDVDEHHGLGIVAQLSRQWGIERHEGGKSIWSELAVPTAAR